MKVQVTKTKNFTNRVLAHDGTAGVLVVDKEGTQDVPDHALVQRLISEGTLKKATRGGRSANTATVEKDKDKAEDTDDETDTSDSEEADDDAKGD